MNSGPHGLTHPPGVVRRIAIVEDHVLQRERTEEVLRARSDLQVVCRCETLPQFLKWLKANPRSAHPHLLVLDLMVDRGPSASPELVNSLTRAGLRVLVLSAMASPPLLRKILRSGVSGVVGKRDSADDLVTAVRTVLDGGEWMTPEVASIIVADSSRPELSVQEERALVLYAAGLTIQAVGEQIGVKPDTAKKYISRVKQKYAESGRAASTKTDLYRVALDDGYLDESTVHGPGVIRPRSPQAGPARAPR